MSSSNTLVTPDHIANPIPAETRGRAKTRHTGTHLLLIALAVMWLIPLLWTLYTALRPKAETDKYGYFSVGGTYNFDNFSNAWEQAGRALISSTP